MVPYGIFNPYKEALYLYLKLGALPLTLCSHSGLSKQSQ